MPHENFIHEHWILTIAFGITMIYGIIALTKKKIAQESYINFLAVFLMAASSITGISYTCKIISNHYELLKTVNLEESEVGYFIIGGGLIIWNASWELYKKFKELYK